MVTSIAEIQITRGTTGTDPVLAYIQFAPAQATSQQLVTLLNGAAHTQECWSNVAESLARRGQRCLTLDYRGQGGSTWSQPVQRATILEKVADVEAVLEAIGADPRQVVLAGHSMGGGIAQVYAARHEVAALVIVASLALGHWRSEVLKQAPGQVLRHPLVYPQLGKDPSRLFATPRLARAFLFDVTTPAETVQWYLDHCFCHESGQAMMQIISVPAQPLRTRRILFIAGRRDASVHSVRQSAAAVGAPLLELDAPHDMLLVDPGREQVAAAVWAFAQQCWQGGAA